MAEGNSKKPVYQMHKWWARRLGQRVSHDYPGDVQSRRRVRDQSLARLEQRTLFV